MSPGPSGVLSTGSIGSIPSILSILSACLDTVADRIEKSPASPLTEPRPFDN
jgi:hypothetical protein